MRRPTERERDLDRLDLDAVQRPEISDESRNQFVDARGRGDLQAQVDVIWHILTGEQLGE